MKVCPSCGQEIDEQVTVCPNCNTDIVELEVEEESSKNKILWIVSIAILVLGGVATLMGKLFAGLGFLVVAMLFCPFVIFAMKGKIKSYTKTVFRVVVIAACTLIIILDFSLNLYNFPEPPPPKQPSSDIMADLQ